MPRIMQSVPVVILLSIVAFAAALCISCDANNEEPIDPIEPAPAQPENNPDADTPLDVATAIKELIRQGKIDKATELADRFVERNPQNAEAYLLRGNVKIALAERAAENKDKCAALLAGAIEDYNKAGEYCRQNDYRPCGYRAEAYCFMAEVDGRHRDRYYEMALAEIEAANKIAGNDIPALEQLRMGILAQTGRRDESLAALEKLARDNPNEPQHAYMLARYAFERDEIAKAREWLDETLRRDAKFLAALYDRASILIEQNRFDEALGDIEAIKKVMADRKDNDRGMADDLAYLEAILRLNRGRYMIRHADAASMETFKAARAEVAEGIKLLESLDRENEARDFFVLLARIEVGTTNASGHYRQAIAEIEKREQSSPTVMPRLRYGLGLALFAENNDGEVEAVKEIEKAAAYADRIGEIMANPAARAIDRLLARRACAEAVLTRGKMNLQVMNNPEAARKDFQRYKKLRPWGDEADRVLVLLYECDLAEIVGRELGYEDCVEYLEHPYYKIRAAAIKMLSNSDDAKCKQAIAGMLGDENGMVLRMAIHVVKSRRIRDNLAGLCALFAHKDEVVAIDAIDCAATLKEHRTVPALIDALEDKRIAVREEAINALMDITTHSMFYHYDDSEQKRAEAVKRWREWWAKESEKDSPGR